MSRNQPLEKQNDAGFRRRQHDDRASTITHQITGVQGNTFRVRIDQRMSSNLRLVNFDRTTYIHRATGIHGICSGYRRQMIDTCPALILNSEIVNRGYLSSSPRWSCISTGERRSRRSTRYVQDSKIMSILTVKGWRYGDSDGTPGALAYHHHSPGPLLRRYR